MSDDKSLIASQGATHCDLLVAGGGVVGLWLVRLASKAGLRVILCDAHAIGSGASGGMLGALMPHMPERWNPKKAFQYAALASLGPLIAELEAETGLTTGYRRIGRLLPLLQPHHRALAEERRFEAMRRWQTAETGFDWRVLDAPLAPDWPAGDAAPCGLVHETLAARSDPRALIAALTAALRMDANVVLIEGNGISDWQTGRARLADGTLIPAGHLAIAAGVESFPLLRRLAHMPDGALPLGKPVKGQAALLALETDRDAPLIFSDGVYIVPHDGDRVAIGSTSEDIFDDPFTTDEKLSRLIEKACRLAPCLEGARVVERWAGLRPKPVGRDPMIGPIAPGSDVIAVTGGFKITLGIAHRMAACALDCITGNGGFDLPESFRFSDHRRKATGSDAEE